MLATYPRVGNIILHGVKGSQAAERAGAARQNPRRGGASTRARITKPVLYDHYSSKHALFREALESIRDRLIGKGKSIVEAGGDPEHQFRLAVDAFLKFVEQEPDAARVLLRVPSGDATAAQLSREVQAGASAGI